MKTEAEIKLDNALNEYFAKFGENYPLLITALASTEEIIEDVEACIANGEPKPEPELDEDVDY